MTDRRGGNQFNAQRPSQPGTFYQKRNTTQPGNQQQFKRRSHSNIGKGSRLASNPREQEEEYPPRIGKSSMSYVQA
jgi:hypothetical protein